MACAAREHRSGGTERAGRRIIELRRIGRASHRAAIHVGHAGTARDEHAAVGEENGSVTFTWCRHGSGGTELPGRGVVDLGRRHVVLQAATRTYSPSAGDEHAA